MRNLLFLHIKNTIISKIFQVADILFLLENRYEQRRTEDAE